MIITSDISVSLKHSNASDEVLSELLIHTNSQNTVKYTSIADFEVSRDSVLLDHLSFTFLVSAPVFSFRSFMRERLIDYYENPGINRIFDGRFYIPNSIDPALAESISSVFSIAYSEYKALLSNGVHPSDARIVLPISTYSDMVITLSASQLLRLIDKAKTTSHIDVQEIVLKMADIAKENMPLLFSKLQ